MGKYSPRREISHGVDEVAFKNHISEFERFYTNHKGFCDEVAGIKPRTIQENGEHKQFYVTKLNFIFGIRKLLSFVADNLHYIKSIHDLRDIERQCYKLEEEYLLDETYQTLKDKKLRSASEEMDLTKRYLEYIIKVYKIGNLLSNLLQSSLMIATSRVSKDVEYHNETNFFQELSRYRTEITDSISNYRFSDTLMQYKKILGYYYTYKILLKLEEVEFTDNIMEMLMNEILKENVIKLIQKASTDRLNSSEKKEMQKLHMSIKKALLKIYYITNKNLSDRKILPKILRKVHIDKTLI